MSIPENGYHDDGLGPSRFLPEGRRLTVVEPARATKRLNTPFVDMVGTVRHEADNAAEQLQKVVDQLRRDKAYATPKLLRLAMERAHDGLAEALFAIRACRKAVE